MFLINHLFYKMEIVKMSSNCLLYPTRTSKPDDIQFIITCNKEKQNSLVILKLRAEIFGAFASKDDHNY